MRLHAMRQLRLFARASSNKSIESKVSERFAFSGNPFQQSILAKYRNIVREKVGLGEVIRQGGDKLETEVSEHKENFFKWRNELMAKDSFGWDDLRKMVQEGIDHMNQGGIQRNVQMWFNPEQKKQLDEQIAEYKGYIKVIDALTVRFPRCDAPCRVGLCAV